MPLSSVGDLPCSLTVGDPSRNSCWRRLAARSKPALDLCLDTSLACLQSLTSRNALAHIPSSTPDTEPPAVSPAQDSRRDTRHPGQLAGACHVAATSEQAAGGGGPRWSGVSGEWAGSGHSSLKGSRRVDVRRHIVATSQQATVRRLRVLSRGRPGPPPSQDVMYYPCTGIFTSSQKGSPGRF